MSKKKVDFMCTAFRDGFQSVYGARVFTKDFMPAVAAAREAGITHFEAGGGARFQALYFYCQEDAFEMMDLWRKTVGPDVNLQTLARGVNVVIEEIKLVPLKGGKALVLIVTDAGIIADKTIDVDCDLKHEYVESASEVLNKVFCGRSAEELASVDAESEIADQIGDFRDIFDTVLAIIRSYVAEHSDDLAVEGALKMLDYPEYDVADAKNFLSVISDRGSMSELLEDAEDSIEFSVRIGKEDSGVDKCAIITASYKVGDEVVGRAGVIGPERMDYKKVIGVLDYMKKTLSTVLGTDDDRKDDSDEK